MSVFISHRKTDVDVAKTILRYLESNDVPCYIDELDESLKSAVDITSVIMRRISESTHMLAVVSPSTEKSWWVPFEIGVASKDERRISTYKAAPVTLPHYLEIWPIMSNRAHLDRFIQLYKGDRSVLLEKSATQYELNSAIIKTADQFHKDLKRSIGQ